MLLFCPRGHEQTGLPALGGLCATCTQENPEYFKCKNPDCPNIEQSQHFHPTDESYFVDINGHRVG